MTALDTGDHLAAHTEDLSLLGCFVETTTPFLDGANVRLRISHDGVIFAADGRVAHSHEHVGMGIAFTSVDPRSVSILDGWLTEIRKT